MTRVPMTQAVAADYADAMLVARRAKNVLFLLLSLILLVQLGLFFVARYVPSVKVRIDTTTNGTELTAPASTSTTSTSQSITMLDHTGSSGQLWSPFIEQILAITSFTGVLFAIVLPVILLLVIGIMLVGRLVGVSHVTSAFCWSIVVLVFLFPWQSLLNSRLRAADMGLTTSTPTPLSTIAPSPELPDIRIPGVLYTFVELRRDFDFPNNPWKPAALKWTRYVGFPVVELILLLMVQGRSSRGLRFALGEAELPAIDYPPHGTV